jgi:hypothetical protein
MANSKYPENKDDLTGNLSGNDPLNNPSHSDTHNATNDAVNAIQNYVGLEGDTTTGTLTGNLHVTAETVNENSGKIEGIETNIIEIGADVETINNLIFSGTEGEDPLVVTGSHNVSGLQLWLGTKAEYDAINAYNEKTLYVVT